MCSHHPTYIHYSYSLSDKRCCRILRPSNQNHEVEHKHAAYWLTWDQYFVWKNKDDSDRLLCASLAFIKSSLKEKTNESKIMYYYSLQVKDSAEFIQHQPNVHPQMSTATMPNTIYIRKRVCCMCCLYVSPFFSYSLCTRFVLFLAFFHLPLLQSRTSERVKIT